MTSVSYVVSFLKFYVKLTLVNRDFILPPKLIANGRLRSKGNYKHLSDRRIMANPTHRSVLLDHQMIVDGVLMREMKDLTKTLNDETGVEEGNLSLIRVIGKRIYTAKQTITDDGEGYGEVQVNLCQKLLFLHQLAHNMMTDCSLNYKFNT